ncbi:hypothetical protein HMPREF9244_00525 [Alloscardovia omnicolens F0580]|uniref:Uncharacterized protein n=1 Tax=Alloscardovia omnicolens F0580 TaxID=1321816 RepID=U1RB74_9BIFI|nr:hypothetical protein HMPREF9244_00525 [Alloscardovia omnicolens F0580]
MEMPAYAGFCFAVLLFCVCGRFERQFLLFIGLSGVSHLHVRD